MSILVIGDLHITKSNEREINIFMTDIMTIIANNNISFIVILGDTLDNMGKIDMDCLCRASDLFELLTSSGKQVFVLIGNHDRKNNKEYLNDIHPFRGFKYFPGLHIISTCFVYNYTINDEINQIAKNMKFCFMPYVPNGMYMKTLEDFKINIKEIDIFFSHSEFDGCKINKLSKTKCEVWPLEYPLNISGHIHNYEIVQHNLKYTGTPFQQDFTEPPNKGVYLIDLKEPGFKLTKLSLNIPPKIVIKVNYTELESLILDPNINIKLHIFGPTSHVKDIMNRPDMVVKFKNVSKKYSEETKDKHVINNNNENNNIIEYKPNNLQFYNSFIQKVSEDKRMYNVYSALFTNKTEKLLIN
jgi:DNA repair exonuclease SbcCD nuclease subunit